MKYETFIKHVSHLPIFGHDIISCLDGSSSAKHVQINRWVKSGKLIRLKRGLFTLPPPYQKIPFSKTWLANTLYSPSYISLEYALSQYDLIPERVVHITSISIHKTMLLTNPLGQFHYRHVKDNLFFGFTEEKNEFNTAILTATPEKALLDMLYLSSEKLSIEFFTDYLRLQQIDQIDITKLTQYAERFGSKKMTHAASLLTQMVQEDTL